jgi:hypothetical protein
MSVIGRRAKPLLVDDRPSAAFAGAAIPQKE